MTMLFLIRTPEDRGSLSLFNTSVDGPVSHSTTTSENHHLSSTPSALFVDFGVKPSAEELRAKDFLQKITEQLPEIMKFTQCELEQ
ncbi:hypothetical protein PAAG_12305 [Paracoccidioides lutzii Pb01]|uniref:Uncharacterized protein n=1 Tax=Paracoccidioides lutzii (strain ATCC MYA-826 / Pb01) TaxID=502779 RepID=A0A0A2V3P3_PARBA|nr:hypothetical protein PAAG_12305 [Paracoccidioides lutzii Pb01]KGQ00997.1 hypothetical protein PAAG_12305 [Paracoccidioides lutzii Pb01]